MTRPDLPLLVVVTGPPAAGKTTVARELAGRLRLPLIAKDTICGRESRLAALPARFVQVHCGAPLEVLVERYGNRERHPGHVDGERIDALREAVQTGRHEPLDLPGETIRIDTTQRVDLEALAEHLRSATD